MDLFCNRTVECCAVIGLCLRMALLATPERAETAGSTWVLKLMRCRYLPTKAYSAFELRS